MCIAICSPLGATIPKEHLVECFQSNPDGAGFMFAENNELNIQKGFMDFESFYKAYKPHEAKALALHFRITTHGKTDEDNTHPFRVGKNLGFIHNGIISRVERKDNMDMSDTYHFNTKFLQQFYKRDNRFIYKEAFKNIIKEYITGSKLVFLNNKGHHTIVNEAVGHWSEGVWYSNSSYKSYVRTGGFNNPTPKKTGVTQVSAKNKEGTALTLGTEVEVVYPLDSTKNFKGTIAYFSNGSMVGVQRKGTRLCLPVWIGYLSVLEAQPSLEPSLNPFKAGDWVQRVDDTEDSVGEVSGVYGNTVVLRWADHKNNFSGPETAIEYSLLTLWWNTDDEQSCSDIWDQDHLTKHIN